MRAAIVLLPGLLAAACCPPAETAELEARPLAGRWLLRAGGEGERPV